VLPYKPYELAIRARYRLIVELVFKETSLVTCKEVTFPHFIVIGVVSFIKFATNKPPGKKLTSTVIVIYLGFRKIHTDTEAVINKINSCIAFVQ
jgi:hypothetical protein